jgi:hypothetical protein
MTTATVIHFVRKVSLYFSTPAGTRKPLNCYVKREVVSVEEKIKVIRETETGGGNEVCREFGLVYSMKQTI